MLVENEGLKFLIFAYHHNMMDGIAETLLDQKIKYIRIDGNTPRDERPVRYTSRTRTGQKGFRQTKALAGSLCCLSPVDISIVRPEFRADK